MSQAIVSGILFGGIYALLAVPLNLLFGTTRVIHFAYGSVLMLGMYTSSLVSTHWALDPYKGGFAVTALIFLLLGVMLYAGVFSWLVNRHYTQQIIVTLALGLVMDNGALFLWTENVRSLVVDVSSSSVTLLGVTVPYVQLIAFVAAMVLGVGVLLFLRLSYWGRAMAAVAQTRRGAEVVGISVKRVYLFAVVLSTTLTGIAGAFILPIFAVYPSVGTSFIVIAFVIVVLGGLGSIGGAFLAAMVVGLVQSLTATYVSIQWETLAYFALFLAVLIFRPAGIAGVRGTEGLGHA